MTRELLSMQASSLRRLDSSFGAAHMASGSDILSAAIKHLKEPYDLGADVPFDDPMFKGPWDCAEFASWVVYQVSGIVYGCVDDTAPIKRLEPYSGGWAEDAEKKGIRISIAEAKKSPGAFLIRRPRLHKIGHVVVSDGKGGTIEAKSTSTGVARDKTDGRIWDLCVLIPGVSYQ